MRFLCPHCGHQVALARPVAGGKHACPACGKTFAVPQTAVGNEPPAAHPLSGARNNPPPKHQPGGGGLAKAFLIIVFLLAAGFLAGMWHFRESAPDFGRRLMAVVNPSPGTTGTAEQADRAGPVPPPATEPAASPGAREVTPTGTLAAAPASPSPAVPVEAVAPMVPEDLPTGGIDLITFGDPHSERGHDFSETRSERLTGGLNQPARRLLSGGPYSWQGGEIEFTLKVDPKEQNYFTVKLWGSDKGYESAGRLVLFADGKQVGYRHEGDHDLLNQADEDPLAPGRFVYATVSLPPAMTAGRSDLRFRIVGTGRIWPYGNTFERYQRDFIGPSRGIYRAYVHTTPRFEPAATEIQGREPEGEFRATSGPEVVARSKDVVIERLRRILDGEGVPGNDKARSAQLMLLAEAYQTEWTPAHRNRRTLEKIVQLGDAMALAHERDPAFIRDEWVAAGALGQAVLFTWPEIRPFTEAMVRADGGMKRRRDLWSTALAFGVENWRNKRRSYTNQSMIVDYGIHAANAGLRLLDPRKAIPEARTLGFLHESVGLKPWLGSDLPDGGSEKPFGADYHLVTRDGLSRELGYVASYGETILIFSRDMAVLAKDQAIREQTKKLQHARHVFRYPSFDGDGYRCMKLASEIDNRIAHYPQSGSAYNSADVREAWGLETAWLLPEDPAIVGVAQQAIEEGQYFQLIADRLDDPDTLGMMRNVAAWERVKDLPKSPRRLPMSPGQPDFVFCDEENAVLAIKRGEHRLFFNFYFRAERAVNRVVRVFETTPEMTRVATVRSEVVVEESGKTWERPDWMDRLRNRGQVPPGQDIKQAWAGEILPVAKRPDDATSPAYGQFGPFVGMAAFHSLRYGPFLIGINTTRDKTYPLRVPADFKAARDLASGRPVANPAALTVGPLSSIILVEGE